MKDIIKQFARECFESTEFREQVNTIIVGEDFIDVKPATRNMNRTLVRLRTGSKLNVDISREKDVNTFTIREKEDKVTLSLTEAEVAQLHSLSNMISPILAEKIDWLWKNFDEAVMYDNCRQEY